MSIIRRLLEGSVWDLFAVVTILWTRLEEVRDKKDHKDCHEGPLYESGQNVAPVVFIIGHSGQSCVNGRRDEEELERGSKEARPLELQPSL